MKILVMNMLLLLVMVSIIACTGSDTSSEDDDWDDDESDSDDDDNNDDDDDGNDDDGDENNNEENDSTNDSVPTSDSSANNTNDGTCGSAGGVCVGATSDCVGLRGRIDDTLTCTGGMCCMESGLIDDGDDDDVPLPTDTGAPPVDTGSDEVEDTPDDTPADCDALPPLPINSYELYDVSGCENLTFDNVGQLVCVTMRTDILTYVRYPDIEEQVYPGITGGGGGGGLNVTVRALRFLPDGRTLVYADRINSAIRTIDTETLQVDTLYNPVNEPNGIAVDFNGVIFFTNLADDGNWVASDGPGNVRRIDPITNEVEVIFTAESTTIDGITLSPDHRTLYFASEEGTLYRMPLNEDGTPAGEGEVFARVSGVTDEITSDECGNVYVLEMDGLIYRVSPDGSVETAVTLSGGNLTLNAISFGSGIGGWDANSLYAISMNGGLYEIPMGVGRIRQPHLDEYLIDPCPVDGEEISCLPEAECTGQGGTFVTDLACDDSAAVCCTIPEPETTPCPVENENVSCVSPVICSTQGGTVDVELTCEDTTLNCCVLPESDAGVGTDTAVEVETDTDTGEDTACPVDDPNYSCSSSVDCVIAGGEVDEALTCEDSNQSCCVTNQEEDHPCPVEVEKYACLAEDTCAARNGTSTADYTCADQATACCVLPEDRDPCPADVYDGVACITDAECETQAGSVDNNYACVDKALACCAL